MDKLLLPTIIFLICICCPNNVVMGNLQQSIDWFEHRAKDPNISNLSRIENYDSLISIYGDNAPYKFHLEKADLLEKELRFNEAYEAYATALSSIPVDSVSLKSHTLAIQIELGCYANRYTDAVECTQHLLKMSLPDSLTYMYSAANSSLADIHRMLRNYPVSKLYLTRAKDELNNYKQKYPVNQYVKSLEVELTLIEAFTDLDLGKNDAAREKIRLVQAISQDKFTVMRCLAALGLLSARLEQSKEALYYYQQVLDMNLPHPTTYVCAGLYMFQAYTTMSVKEFENAFQKYHHILLQLQGSTNETVYYRILYLLAMKKGDLEAGIEYLDLAFNVNDSIHRTLERNNTMMAIDQFELKRQMEEKNALRRQNLGKTIAIVCLSGLILGISIWVFLLIRRHRQKIRKNADLEHQLDKIDEDHKKEMEESIYNLNSSKQEIALMSMQNNRLNDVLQEIKRLAEDPAQSKASALNTIRRLITEQGHSPDSWAEFQHKVECAYPDFFNKLHRICPDLTNAETRQAAFILMNLTAAEVAEITSRSSRTVTTIRYNLRRKLNITGSSEAYMKDVCRATPKEVEALRANCAAS